jgi:hypothetical protein
MVSLPWRCAHSTVTPAHAVVLLAQSRSCAHRGGHGRERDKDTVGSCALALAQRGARQGGEGASGHAQHSSSARPRCRA